MSFRRIAGTLLASFGLVLLPSAAFAGEVGGDDYGANAEALVVTDTNPAPGDPFNLIVDGGPESDEVTLTVTSDDPAVGNDDIEIAGTQSMTKAATGGVAEFTVTLYVEGRYTAIGFDEAGNRVGRTAIVVGDGTAGEPGNAGDSAGIGAAGAPGGLGSTGVEDLSRLLGGGGALLVAGAGVLATSRRRRARETA